MALVPQDYDAGHRIKVVEIAAGNHTVLDASGFRKLAVAAETGATAVVSRVNTAGASSAQGSPYDLTPPSAGSLSTYDVDWRFYYISAAAGPVKACLA